MPEALAMPGETWVTVGDDYEGWVAWLTPTSPIYEAVPHLPKAAQVLSRGLQHDPRAVTRTSMDWKNVPLDQVRRLELYWLRDKIPGQPVVRIDRPADRWDDIVFIQYKSGSLQLGTGGALQGQARTGIHYYRVGWWDKRRNVSELYELKNTGQLFHHTGAHPCWPRPMGFGMNPTFLDLTEQQVPPAPVTIPVFDHDIRVVSKND